VSRDYGTDPWWKVSYYGLIKIRWTNKSFYSWYNILCAT